MATNRVESGEASSLSGSSVSSASENQAERRSQLEQKAAVVQRAKLPIRRSPTAAGQLTSDVVRAYVGSSRRQPRVHWTPDLHGCFVHAVDLLGGEDRAAPKKILEIMNVEGLTMKHITSHLQKYRNMKVDELIQVKAAAARTAAHETWKHSLHLHIDSCQPESTISSASASATPPWKDEKNSKSYLIFPDIIPGSTIDNQGTDEANTTRARGAIDVTRPLSLINESGSSSQRLSRLSEAGSSSSNRNDISLELTLG